MTDTTAVDISEFQCVVSDAYPYRWLTFRACDGAHLDKHAAANLAWAVRAVKAGRLGGFTVYVVYEPGQNAVALANLDTLGVPTDCTIMVDVESWAGKIRGNHSTEINALVGKLATRQGSRDRVWGYANRSDYAAIWPTRPAWLGLVVASYGGVKPSSPGPGPLAGWQYTDGTYTVPGLPNSSAPFGHCDHNQLYLTAQGGELVLDDDTRTWLKTLAQNQTQAIIAAVKATNQNVTKQAAALKTAVLAALPAGQASYTKADLETALTSALDGATIHTEEN